MEPSPPRGALLVNLGTPEAPTPRAVRRYLREFLGDPRVLTMPAPARWLLLHLVILPTRPRSSARLYESIWTPEGSPLLVHSERLCRAVAAELGPRWSVALGMRYGRPSIRDALAGLHEAGAREIVVLPLFPQAAEATTGSVQARVRELAPADAQLHFVAPFYDAPGFARAWAAVAAGPLERFAPDHVLMSYHGLPVSQLRSPDARGTHCGVRTGCCDDPASARAGCYRAQCFATTRALTRALALDPARTTTAFQSRLGRTEWIRPYTDEMLPRLAAQGVRRLAVACPAFVADCLETLEEIGIRAREQWRAHGGEDFLLLPCPNEHPTLAAAAADWIRAASPALPQPG